MRIYSFSLLLISLTPICFGLSSFNGDSNNIFDIIVEEVEDVISEEVEDVISKDNSVQSDDIPPPPPHDATARMARYITHTSDWGAMATISVRDPIVGYPFANIFSLSDGPEGNSSGIPYMYFTPLEMSVHDLKQNPKASITMSLAQGDYCRKKKYDAEDPRCAHIIHSGEIVKVDKGSEEEKFASEALFSRHPEMPDWPIDHGWYFVKLNLTNVLLLDFFGGAINVPLDDYFSAQPY